MRKAMRALAAAVVAATAWAGVAPADDLKAYVVTNRTFGYEVAYPADWQVATPEGLDFLFLSPDQGTFCMTQGAAVPDMAGVPDADIKTAMSQNLGEQFWNNMFFSDIAGTKYLKTDSLADHPGGWPVQFVVAQGSPDMGNGPQDMIFAGIATFKAATGYLVMCVSHPSVFEANSGGVSVILGTFKINK